MASNCRLSINPGTAHNPSSLTDGASPVNAGMPVYPVFILSASVFQAKIGGRHKNDQGYHYLTNYTKNGNSCNPLFRTFHDYHFPFLKKPQPHHPQSGVPKVALPAGGSDRNPAGLLCANNNLPASVRKPAAHGKLDLYYRVLRKYLN
ncbi:MAG: hypothetical protein JXA13_01445 [Anaerolineales bacterium]|nr:hypothetical protein [Anaerolineales bacterium]